MRGPPTRCFGLRRHSFFFKLGIGDSGVLSLWGRLLLILEIPSNTAPSRISKEAAVHSPLNLPDGCTSNGAGDHLAANVPWMTILRASISASTAPLAPTQRSPGQPDNSFTRPSTCRFSSPLISPSDNHGRLTGRSTSGRVLDHSRDSSPSSLHFARCLERGVLSGVSAFRFRR